MNIRHPQLRRPRGVALVIVLAVVMMATIVGLTLLSSIATQAQVGGNSSQACVSEYLAESGMQAAIYYLQYPQFMPAGWGTTSGYVIKTTGQNIGLSSLGTFDVEAVKTTNRNEYDITAVGHGPTGSIARTMSGRVKVNRVKVQGAAYFGGAVTIPLRTTITGHVQANGAVTNNSGVGLTSSATAPLAPTAYAAPTLATVNYYGADGAGTYETPDGQIGHAQQLLAAPVGAPLVAANNPGKIFYYVGDLTLASPVTINGTLIVKGGTLTIKTSGIQIVADPGYPGLIVENDVSMFKTAVSLQVDGVAWIGRNIVWTGPLNTFSSLRINGALLMPGGSIINSPFMAGSTIVNYTSSVVDVPDMTKTLQPGTDVKILTWNQ